MGRLKQQHEAKDEACRAIGAFVLKRRRELNYTMRDVADIGKLAVTTVCSIENGAVSPHFTTIVKLADVLQTDIREWESLIREHVL